MPARRAVLPAEIDDLEMERVPALAREYRLEVALDLLDVARARQLPAPGEPVDVGVDRERRLLERLRHHHAGGLVADAGELLERRHVARHLAAVLGDQDAAHTGDRLRLARRESAGA